AQPSRCSWRLLSEPGPNGLDEQHVDQARDDHGSAHLRLLGLTRQKPRRRIEPLVPATLVFSHADPRGEYREERPGVWAFELERPTKQLRDVAASTMTQHSVKAPVGTANELRELNGWRFGHIAELVVVSLCHQQQVALFKGNHVTLAVQTQPAGAPF